jgi:hypothetical protein
MHGFVDTDTENARACQMGKGTCTVISLQALQTLMEFSIPRLLGWEYYFLQEL